MSVLATTDFYNVTDFYRIPKGAGSSDSARLEGVIKEAEAQFCERFGYTAIQITGDVKEALKFYTFALWLRTNHVQKTPLGTGAKNRLKEADNVFDQGRYVTAFNRCCSLIGREDIRMKPIFNY